MSAGLAVSPVRRRALGKVHIAAKQLGLDDDDYRDILERVTGKRSAADCTDDELGAVIAEFKKLGFKDRATPPRRARAERPLADGNQQRKIRALWLSLYHLGLVRDPAETAMIAFVKRQTRREALQWLSIEHANKVIEALKAWAERDGGVDWTDDECPGTTEVDGESITITRNEPRIAVIRAQWRRLDAEDALKYGPMADVQHYGARVTGLGGFIWYQAPDFDKLIEALGRWLRGAIVQNKERS